MATDVAAVGVAIITIVVGLFGRTAFGRRRERGRFVVRGWPRGYRPAGHWTPRNGPAARIHQGCRTARSPYGGTRNENRDNSNQRSSSWFHTASKKTTRCLPTIWEAAGRFAAAFTSSRRSLRNPRSRRRRAIVGTERFVRIVGNVVCVTAGRALTLHAVTLDLDARKLGPRSILRRRPADGLRRRPGGATRAQGERNKERRRPDQRSYATRTRRRTGTRQKHGTNAFH
jgi:hypothetical protein